MYSYHLANPGVLGTLRALWSPPCARRVPRLAHAECLLPMQLGANILSPRRWKPNQLAMFAAWNSEDALDAFLTTCQLGKMFANGWHVRLQFVRQWGHIAELPPMVQPPGPHDLNLDDSVVAVTLARLRLPQARRFIRFGKPVERLVRANAHTTLALAAARPLRTLSTFTVWRSLRAMLAMVHGSNAGETAHSIAMAERDRRDFHHGFATLRFRCLAEHGQWRGRGDYVPRSSTG